MSAGIRRVVVCEALVPFVQGGAEFLVRELVRHLRAHGYQTELVSLPFKWYPKEEILAHAAAWRLLDLSESSGHPIDLAIATKFPTYCVRHPNKATWLVHQHRAAYELCDTPYSDFDHVESDVALRESLARLDTEMLSENRRLFTIARNVSARLEKFNGLRADPLYHPPRLADRLAGGPYGDYVLAVGRLESVKRVDLAIRAMAFVDSPMRLLAAGEGSQRDTLERLAETAGLMDRVTLLGRVDDEELLELYAGALAVVYPPYDEDYGYVTLESFLARKPVITARDSGGTLEFVEPGLNGIVCEPEPEAIAAAINGLAADRALARSLGEAGFERARDVTWTGVVERLIGD
jgi:glycosyltransferase involved in cell wall biosynthesis